MFELCRSPITGYRRKGTRASELKTLFEAGIECDGATYHSGFSVRDRDRIRQEILKSLGWKGRIHRIWSTDWFYNPRSEIERLRSFREELRCISAAEGPVDCDEEQDSVLDPEGREDTGEITEELVEAIAVSPGGEDVFVEVEDRVTYCPAETPNDRHNILIVDSDSNPKMNIVNEQTPLAKALLGLSPGDLGDLEISGQKTRQLRVLKIQRN